jgi:DNA primase small subunit
MTIQFIQQKFREYYERHPPLTPPEFEKREFGFGNDKKIDYRHIAFKSDDEFRKYFVSNTPLYASFSAGYYGFPEARPMQKKAIAGADLIFEFDAECEEDHSPTCTECLGRTRDETVRLIEQFLIPDFGFKKSEISVAFSGSRGYHLYVKNPDAQKLTAEARRHIVDYLRATGLDIRRIVRQGATPESRGWRGRLARAAYEHAEKSKLKRFSDKRYILEALKSGNYDLFRGAISSWDKLLSKETIRMTSNIDHTVTIDISRLIRIPSTLHGGSSLLCMYVDKLEKFDPFVDAVVFSDRRMRVKVSKKVPEFTLREQEYGPLDQGETELPEHAALYLICKGFAAPV